MRNEIDLTDRLKSIAAEVARGLGPDGATATAAEVRRWWAREATPAHYVLGEEDDLILSEVGESVGRAAARDAVLEGLESVHPGCTDKEGAEAEGRHE